MVRGDLEISLKFGRPWRGISDSSQQEPADGPFAVLRNCYVSRDGSEIVRMPGLARSGRPEYFDEPIFDVVAGVTTAFTFSAMVTGNPTTVTLVQAHGLKNTGGSFDHICYVQGNVSGPNGIQDGYYTCSRGASSTEVIIQAPSTGVSLTGKVNFFRLRRIGNGVSTSIPWVHGMRQVGLYGCVVAETESWDAAGTTEYRHFAAWTPVGGLDFTNPPRRWAMWPSMLNLPQVVNGAPTSAGSRLDQPLGPKLVLDVTGDTLLVAASMGANYRVDVGAQALSSSTAFLPLTRAGVVRFLGTPKATHCTGTTAGAAGGSLTAGATYWFAIGYRDALTGELGLPSEPQQITLGGGQQQFNVTVFRPRQAIAEAGRLNVVLYLSVAGAASPGAMFLVKEIVGDEIVDYATGGLSVNFNVGVPLDDRYPILEVAPRGASWIRTVRGVTFFGGPCGYGIFDENRRRELIEARNPSGANSNLLQFGNTTPAFLGRMFAGYHLGQSYNGVEVMVADINATVRLVKTINVAAFPAAPQDVWQIDGAFASAAADFGAYLLMPLGQMQFSETGHPGIVPAINNIIIDRLKGIDLITAMKFGESLLVYSDQETYLLAFGRSPLGSDPVQVSPNYGCIAARGCIETPMGVYALSAVGPVHFAPGATWIGRPVRDYFSTALRDSEQLMPHAMATWDKDRELVLFGVRKDWNGAVYSAAPFTSDKLKSRIGCDELLVFSPGNGAFSTWRMGPSWGPVDIAPMTYSDGAERVSVLETLFGTVTGGTGANHNHDVYGFDDRFVDHRDAPLQVTATTGPFFDGTYLTFTGSAAINAALVGESAFIRNGDGELIWFGTILQVDTVNTRVGISDPTTALTWAAGAIIEIGVITTTLETNFIRVSEAKRQGLVNSVTLRYRARRPYPAVQRLHAWARVRARNEFGETIAYHDETYGRNLVPAQHSATFNPDFVNVMKFDRGSMRGNEIKVLVDIISDGVVHLRDLVLEGNSGV